MREEKTEDLGVRKGGEAEGDWPESDASAPTAKYCARHCVRAAVYVAVDPLLSVVAAWSEFVSGA